ncbi:TPA: hypothetical protein ACGJ2Y_005554 [Pseudomonas aeruginosa]|uniref:hypothetical protein n=1 Tax=Pseudomonas aeruginosa TaxID=287 RepID=UPI0014195567|nr:hypothetical protein [Pseudomonas aeruginosa]HBO6166904.1 hypothetical protein [Pseudomonas aeruginosa]HEP9575225.1 hypothetical protein [Pseudomonas aeruginosa]
MNLLMAMPSRQKMAPAAALARRRVVGFSLAGILPEKASVIATYTQAEISTEILLLMKNPIAAQRTNTNGSKREAARQAINTTKAISYPMPPPMAYDLAYDAVLVSL